MIQKHAARRLHYDFRLEAEGVLLSWSVPKGPSLAPTERRLAVRTEDHPIDYADFEGVIPKGQYGGGAVVVWDRGTWQPEDRDGRPVDTRAALEKGRLTFELFGEKLRGRWHLVRTRPQGKQEAWLLFKGRDDAANDTLDITTAEPASVVSGKTIEEVAEHPDRVWQSDRAAEPTAIEKRAARIQRHASSRPARERLPRPEELVAQLPLGFKLTNLDKVLYPDQGITKGQLIAYFAVISEWMLPHVAHRPLTLVRCPEGSKKPCFFQKRVLQGSPEAIRRVELTELDGETVDYMAVDDLAGLVATAQLGSLELHTWGSHIAHVEQPDLMVFDLDPDTGLAWDRVALAAFDLRRRLNELGLESFVKTTGGKGLHVTVPIAPRLSWDEVKAFTKAVAETMEREDPAAYTSVMTKTRRKDRIFVDYLRNGRNATFIAPYSTRARPGAPVAVPITWEELAAGVDPESFTIATVPPRVAAQQTDPWARMSSLAQTLTAAMLRATGAR